MNEFTIEIFKQEVLKQCNFALIAFDGINNFLKDPKNKSTDLFWFNIQSFLISSSNISKLLFGANKIQTNERATLRLSLNINDNSLLKNRTMRNHFEHFDERLYNWSKASANHNYIDSNIGPKSMISGINQDDFFRNFDNTTSIISFREDSFLLQPMIAEIISIKNQIST